MSVCGGFVDSRFAFVHVGLCRLLPARRQPCQGEAEEESREELGGQAGRWWQVRAATLPTCVLCRTGCAAWSLRGHPLRWTFPLFATCAHGRVEVTISWAVLQALLGLWCSVGCIGSADVWLADARSGFRKVCAFSLQETVCRQQHNYMQ